MKISSGNEEEGEREREKTAKHERVVGERGTSGWRRRRRKRKRESLDLFAYLSSRPAAED